MSLARQTASAVRWSALSRLGGQGLAYLTLAVLANLLAPDDFGLMTTATVVTGFLAIFKDLGTASAIIQRETLGDDLLSSVFWLNVLFGVGMTFLLALAAPWIAALYREPRLNPLLAALALNFVTAGLSVVQQALLQRELAFARLAKIEVAAVLAGSAVGITAAILKAGVWSLVAQSLTTSAATTILLWLGSAWRPRLVFRRAEVQAISGYSLNLTGFTVFNYFARNMDYVLIGAFLGAEPLGYYSLAYQIMLLPVQGITGVIDRVTFPTYARLQDDLARLRRAYLRVAATIGLLAFPLALGILATAGPLIEGVYGRQWQPAILALVILAPVGMAQSIGVTVGSIYRVKGRTDWMFRWGVASGLLRTAVFALGLRWGIEGVAAAYAISGLAIMYPNYAIPFRLIDLKVRELVRAVWEPFKYALAMLAGVILVRLAWGQVEGADARLVLLTCVLAGAALYGGLLLWRRPPVVLDAIRVLPLEGAPWIERLGGRQPRP